MCSYSEIYIGRSPVAWNAFTLGCPFYLQDAGKVSVIEKLIAPVGDFEIILVDGNRSTAGQKLLCQW